MIFDNVLNPNGKGDAFFDRDRIDYKENRELWVG